MAHARRSIPRIGNFTPTFARVNARSANKSRSNEINEAPNALRVQRPNSVALCHHPRRPARCLSLRNCVVFARQQQFGFAYANAVVQSGSCARTRWQALVRLSDSLSERCRVHRNRARRGGAVCAARCRDRGEVHPRESAGKVTVSFSLCQPVRSGPTGGGDQAAAGSGQTPAGRQHRSRPASATHLSCSTVRRRIPRSSSRPTVALLADFTAAESFRLLRFCKRLIDECD
jgi:hypothetical protein